jgi:hypothetical protein
LFYAEIDTMRISCTSLIRRFSKTIKSQIPSTKLQINLKSQFPMTKTPTAVGLWCFTNLCPPVMMSFGIEDGGAWVWNFEFGSLEFV